MPKSVILKDSNKERNSLDRLAYPSYFVLYILALREVHTKTLLKIKQLKRELNELQLQFKNGNKKIHDRICQISEDILINKEVIQEQSRMLKMYKQKNADFHRRYHNDIVQRKKYIAGTLKQQPID